MNRRLLIILLVAIIGCGQPFFPEASRGKGKGPKPPPEPTEMGIRFIDGAERRIDTTTNSMHPFTNCSNGSATARTGSRSISLTDTTFDTISYDYNFDHGGGVQISYNISDTRLSFYLRRTGTSDGVAILRIRDTVPSNKLELKWNSTTNKLSVVTATGTTNGDTVLSVDTWYRIDVRCGTGASAFWEVRIDGTSEMSATEDLLTGTMASFVFVRDASTVALIDDIVLRDDQYHPGDDFRVENIFPDADGNYTAWTGTWTDVDEKSSDGSEATTSTQNDRETYALENIPALSGDDTIDAVMVVATVRKTVNAAVNCQIIERESSTDRDTVNFLVLKNDNFQDTFRWLIQTTKPSGGAWTESAVNGYEVGLEHNQSQARAILLDNINVNVLISTTAAPAGGKAGFMTLLGVQ